MCNCAITLLFHLNSSIIVTWVCDTLLKLRSHEANRKFRNNLNVYFSKLYVDTLITLADIYGKCMGFQKKKAASL